MFIKTDEVTSVDLSKVAQPSFNHLDVQVLGTKLISIDDIFIDPTQGNKTRQITNDNVAHIESLKMSFAQGIDLNQYPPCVIPTTQKTKEEFKTSKPYELVYGFHRLGALIELHLKTYFFTVISTDERGVYSVRMEENEPLPKLDNKEVDLKAALGSMIKEGLIEKTEPAVRAQLNLVARSRKKQSKDKIVQMVMHDNGIPSRFMFYSPSQAIQWCNLYSNGDYQFGGEWDSKRKLNGFLCKEGYLYRTVWRAMKKFVQDGEKSYVISHMGAPTKSATLSQKRENFQSELDSMKEIMKGVGVTEDFLEHLGSLPQDRDNDNWTKLV